jgi:nitronate monooxygenase
MAGGITTPNLVASISNAGGLGILAGTRLTPEQIKEQINMIRSLTNKPFGINFLIAPPEPNRVDLNKVQEFLDHFREELNLPAAATDMDIAKPPSMLSEQLATSLEEKIPLVSFGLGDPSRFVSEVHAAGAKVMGMVTTVDEAVTIANGGADIVVAQGSEAGGHRSSFEITARGDVPLIGTFALVPQVVDAVAKVIPVVAAGGIMDGRGIAAALALGASGVMLGTRFLPAQESGAFAGYKDRILSGRETDTVITRGFSGRPARAIKNKMVKEFERANFEPLAWPLQALAADDIYSTARSTNNTEYYPLLAGQGLRIVKNRHEESASSILTELVKETLTAIHDLTKFQG